jgi:O-antigen/teichoic acid export membrane protein
MGEVFSKLIRAGIVIYAARILGASEFGAFAFVMAIANFLAISSDFGVTPIVSREVARGSGSHSHYLWHGILLKGSLLVVNVIAVVIIIPSFVTLESALPLFPLVALMLVFDSLRDFVLSIVRALERMELEAIIKVVSNVLIAVLGFIFIHRFLTTFSFLSAYVVGGGIGFFLAAMTLFSILPIKKVATSTKVFAEIVHSAWPLALLALVGGSVLNIDLVMIGWLSEPEQVGFYAAGQRLVQLFYGFFAIASFALFPVVMRLSHQGKVEGLRLAIERGVRVNLAIAIPALVGGVLVSRQIIETLYTATYLPAVPSFIILLTTFILMAPSAIINIIILAYNQQRWFLKFTLVVFIINIALNFVLIPSFGISGAAIATLISQSIATAVLFIGTRRSVRYSIFSGLHRILIANVILAVVVILLLKILSLPLALLIVIGASSYFFVLFILKEPLVTELLATFRQMHR